MDIKDYKKIINDMAERNIQDIGFACDLLDMVGDGRGSLKTTDIDIKRPKVSKNNIGSAEIGEYFIIDMKDDQKVRFDCVDTTEDIVRFDSHDCVLESRWNETNTNKGGYAMSLIRKNVDAFLENIPKELAELIIPTERKLYEGESITTKLFIPDEGELFDDDEIYNERIYTQLDWYKDCRNRMKGFPFKKEMSGWWTASANSGYATNAVFVNTYGLSNSNGASNAFRVPICFHVNRTKVR